jgi:hypothetical protein
MKNRTEDFQKYRKDKAEDFESKFWLIWILACVIGWWFWKPALWFILVPTLKYIFSNDWKKENERINKESKGIF